MKEQKNFLRIKETEEAKAAREEKKAALTATSSMADLLAAVQSTYEYEVKNGQLTGYKRPYRLDKAEVVEKSGTEIIISARHDEFKIDVYDSGVSVVTEKSSNRKTVDGVDRVLEHLGVTESTSEKEMNKILGMPWPELLGMDGELRLAHNQENRETSKKTLALAMDGSDTVEGATVPDYETLKEMAEKKKAESEMKGAMRDKLPDALKALKDHSEKQYQAVVGREYTKKPVPYKDLAKQIGVSISRVNALAKDGVTFLQKYMAADAEMTSLIAKFEA